MLLRAAAAPKASGRGGNGNANWPTDEGGGGNGVHCVLCTVLIVTEYDELWYILCVLVMRWKGEVRKGKEGSSRAVNANRASQVSFALPAPLPVSLWLVVTQHSAPAKNHVSALHLSLSLFLSCFSTAYSLLLMAVRRGVGRSGSTACRVPTRPYNRGCPESCLAGANTLAERREALERGRESRKKEERATGERA